MSFSPAQQGLFRPMVAAAWAVTAPANGCDPKDKAQREEWYRAELERAIGATTTKDCNATRDFETLMAHFEAIGGAGFYWNLRIHKGNARRVLHELRQLAAAHNYSEEYLQEIARRATRKETLPDIADLTAEDLLKVFYSLRKQTRRLKRSGNVEQPF
jgi:hypothetical protein